MKVQISLDDELLQRIDSYADENYMTRSGFITLACTQLLNQSDVTKAIKDMSLCMKKISEKGNVDDEMLQELEDFDRLARMLYLNQPPQSFK